MNVLGRRFDRALPDRGALLRWGLLVNTEVLLVFTYVAFLDGGVRRPLVYLYPFVWLNAAVWAVRRVSLPTATARVRSGAAAVALAYFSVLTYAGGVVGASGGRSAGLRIALASLPPGWAPAVLYDGASVSVALVPFKVVGYATLAYLAYALALGVGQRRPTNRDGETGAASGFVGGFVGLFSCVSCTLPLIAGVVSGVAGGGTALAAAAYGQSYALSTVAFVVTVALLTWRPTVGTVRRTLG